MITDQSTTQRTLEEADLTTLLRMVGLPPNTSPAAYGTSLDDLGLDSLARIEMAAMIQERFGIDIEAQITARMSPASLRALVNTRLAAHG